MLEDRIVEEDEREMIDGIFDLEETTTREIMVPRMDVVALSADTSLQEALDVIIRDGYSRLPVFRSSIDDVVGILYAKDLFPRMRDGRLDGVVGEMVRPAYFIPESKKVSELLRELQKRKVHIAVAVDEYGGTSGLVTIEDLLEEIVGEIQDEFDSEEAKIVEGSEGEAFFDATVSIDDVNDTLGTILEGEEVDTIGGLVYELLGRVPLVGDQVSTSNSSITVVSTSGRRVTRVRVNRTDLEAAGAPPLADSA
jgi:CBS domain containing-hemolysin-like protein